MKTTRRTFLKAATIAASMTSLLPFGKAEAAKEPAFHWMWRIGEWEMGRRKWESSVWLPWDIAKRFYNTASTTNQRVFCGVRKDCLFMEGASWTRSYKDKAAPLFTVVSLLEYRKAFGYINIFDKAWPKRRPQRRRIYNRSNFHTVMPGLHSFPASVFPRGDWIVPDSEVMDRVKRNGYLQSMLCLQGESL